MSRYVRKTDRPYVRITNHDIEEIRHWHRARTALGTQKEFAARLNIAENRVAAVVAKIRAGQL